MRDAAGVEELRQWLSAETRSKIANVRLEIPKNIIPRILDFSDVSKAVEELAQGSAICTSIIPKLEQDDLVGVYIEHV